MITAIAQRPNLAIEAKARRNCRGNLNGLRCRDDSGQVWTIRATTWDIGTTLLVSPTLLGEPWVLASTVTLIDPWPPSCCRSKLGSDGLPKRRRSA